MSRYTVDYELKAQMELQEALFNMDKMEAEQNNIPPTPPPFKKPIHQKHSRLHKLNNCTKWTQLELNGKVFEVHPSGLVRRLKKT